MSNRILIGLDFLLWNQVPVNKDSAIDPRVGDYLAHWTKKFGDAGISYGGTIPYLSEVVTAMIADISQDLPAIVHQLGSYIDDLKKKMSCLSEEIEVYL